MDEMPPAAALPFGVGSSPFDGLAEGSCSSRLPEEAADSVTVACSHKADGASDFVQACISSEGALANGYADSLKPGIDGDDVLSVVTQPSFEESGSPSAVSDSSSIGCTVDELLDVELISRSSMVVVDGVSNDVGISAGESGFFMPMAVDCDTKLVEKGSAEEVENALARVRRRNPFVSENVPLWGCMSICGRRPEMEDAVTALPRCFEVPFQMLGSQGSSDSGINQRPANHMAHFFGVYDGHGGAQVANYCKERVHAAFIEEIRDLRQVEGTSSGSMLNQWERAFTSCFNKVDGEVAGERASASHDGSIGPFEAIAPETVGSTAVVAVVCSSHIIVANCGDSRAVLFRGKQPVPLSIDHKPNREDEYARIEAAGGKVIQWNGYRVLGVLAMSRSIGDRYLKPWVISEPEVMCVPRAKEDECLVLATDGLWDVLSNEEVCETARKRILLWHKKNGGNPLERRGDDPDPASDAAADYLTKLAIHRGSKDNVTVIVIDLKTHRKFKTKT